MDQEAVQAWLDGYVEAWRTYDPAAIGALFTPDAVYRFHPWDAPVTGRDAIVASWTADPDEPGSWAATYEAWAMDGRRAVAVGRSTYDGGARVYHNVFLLEFDGEGRCRSFTEVFALQPPAA